MALRSLFVDFNSFFASIEQQENDALRGRPVGVVPVAAETTCCIAASVEAKTFGVRTGTLVREARKRCPGIVLVQARPALYVEYHQRLKDAIETCLPISYVGSIDEVACELIGRERERDRAVLIAQNIKAAVRGVGGWLRCSIGIAPNHFLSKTASDMQKPDGLTVLEPHDVPHKLHPLALSDLCGIGPNMEQRLLDHGIRSVEQLCGLEKSQMREIWGGVEGERYWAALRGEWQPHRESKRGSVGHSHVLGPEFRTAPRARAVLKKLLVKAAMRVRDYGLVAGALHVKIKHVGADPWEGGIRFDDTDDSRSLLRSLALVLRQRDRHTGRVPLRGDRPQPLAVGVTLQRLRERSWSSGSLFSDDQEDRALNGVIDRINRRYGHNTLYFGGMQAALTAAPMRIPFQHIPNAQLEGDAKHNPLWLERVRQFKRVAEAEHQRWQAARTRTST